MTDEQKEQLAKEYAENEYKIGDAAYDKAMANLIERVYLDALDARDDEFALLKAKIEDDNAVMMQLKAELAKAQNPWRDAKTDPPKEGQSVTARNDYGDKGYNHCVCVFKGGKFVVVVTNLTTGETQEIENNYVKAWMPIPEGGKV